MPLSETQYDEVLDLAGTGLDRNNADMIFDRKGSVELTALTWLRRVRATMVTQPMQWNAAGDYGESWFANTAALDRQIARVERLAGSDGIDGSGGVAVARMTRSTRSRMWTP